MRTTISNRSAGRLAIVVGIDGAGKSTVIERLNDFQTSHWGHLRHVSGDWAKRVETARDVMKSLKGIDRTAFILSLIEGEWKECIEPHLVAGRDVVCDGFYLRPLVKEMVFGDGDTAAIERASPLSGRELVVLIDVPVEFAVSRKAHDEISTYERFESPSGFADFQSAQRDELFAILKNWKHVVIDGTQPEEHVATGVRTALERHGIRPRGFTRKSAAPGRGDALA